MTERTIKIRKVHEDYVEQFTRYFADNIHENDRKELQAMGRFNDEAAYDALSHGVGREYCFTASIDAEKGEPVWLAIGGWCPVEGTVWFITTKYVDTLTRTERVRFGLALKGVMQRLLKEYPNVAFRNIVSMVNHSHIKLIKALGGKGFNTLYENTKSGSMFYPFYFINNTKEK